MDKPKKPELEQQLHEYFSQMGRKGGIKAGKNMTPKERVKRAQKAVNTRWARARKEGKA